MKQVGQSTELEKYAAPETAAVTSVAILLKVSSVTVLSRNIPEIVSNLILIYLSFEFFQTNLIMLN